MRPKNSRAHRVVQLLSIAIVVAAIAFLVGLLIADVADSKPIPKLTLSPSTITAGESTTMRGSGLSGEARFTLFAAVDGKRARVGWAKTDTWGRFRGTFRTVPGTLPGRFTLTVCRKGSCQAERASATLVVRRR